MRPLRRLLSTEVYFVTVRTVEQRFAVDPYACPDAWKFAADAVLDLDTKIAMRERGRACVEYTDLIAKAIARSEQDLTIPRPEVPFETYSDSIPNIIGSCMAEGVDKYNVHLYGVVWMSNHAHLLLRAKKEEFAAFMTYLNGQIAIRVNRFLGRKAPLWERRYVATQVLDDDAEMQLLGYLLANPQNAGIADSIGDWPGVSSAPFLLEGSQMRFLRFDRTAWHKQGRPNDIAPFLSTIVLKHGLLPQLAKRHPTARRVKILRAIASELKHPHGALPYEGDSRRVVIPTDRPKSAKQNPRKRSRQPLCHTTRPLLRRLFIEGYRAFRVAYQECSIEYRKGNTNIEFPHGAFPPSRFPRARHPQDSNWHTLLQPTRKSLERAALVANLGA